MNNYTITKLTFPLSFAPEANYYYDVRVDEGEIWGVAKTYEDAIYKIKEIREGK